MDLIRGLILIVLAALVSLPVGAAKALNFDGATKGAVLGGNQLLLGGNIGTLQFRVTPDGKSGQGPILEMLGGSLGFSMGFTEDRTGLLFISAAGEYTILPPGFNVAVPHLISMQLMSGSAAVPDDQAWVLSVDGKQVGIVPGVLHNDNGGAPLDSGYTPTPGDRVKLTLGGEGFIGTIDQFEIRTPDNLLYAQLSSAGVPVRRTLPIFGAYLQTDADVGVQQVDLLPQITAIHHGIFNKATYYALSRVSSKLAKNGAKPDEVLLSVDWGGVVVMVPDPNNPNRYQPENYGQRWVGSIEFDSDAHAFGSKVHFKSVGSQAVETRPFLEDGKLYELAPVRPDGLDKSVAIGIAKAAPRQTSGFVFNVGGTPPNFNFSLNACYNVITMNLANFQETGCKFPIFTAPDREGAYKAVPPHILPLGWNWQVDSASEESSKSTLATSAQELNTALTGGSSSDFSALGYSVQHNTQTEHEQSDLTSKDEMQSVQQYFRRSQSIILAPTEVELDQCLIHYVLRAAATAFATQAGTTVDQLPDWAMPQGPSYYDADQAEEQCSGAGSRRDPLTPQALLAKYGTHYAAAITYGSRTIEKSQYSASTIRSLVSDSADLSDAEGFEFNATVTAGGGKASVALPIKIGKTTSKTSSNGTSSSNETTAKKESASIICYGSPCAAGLPQEGNLPIPMYLDLVRFDYLLAPPFFTDPLVVALLRPAVAKELDRVLMDQGRNSLLTSLRVVDVELKAADCWQNPNYPKSQGALQSGGWCSDIDYLGGISAFTTKPGGGSEHVDLKPIDADDGEGVQPISTMKQCLTGSGSPTCDRRKFRLIVDSYVQKPGAVLADDAIIGFLLGATVKGFTGDPSQMVNDLQLYDETSSCGKACAGRMIGYDWPFHLSRPVYSKALYFSRAQPTPESVSGRAFIEADPTTKDPTFSFNITLSLKDAISEALGYANAVQDPPHPEILSVDSVKPATAAKEFAWQSADGMLNDAEDLTAARKRCEAEFGYGNCEPKSSSYWSKPADQRSYPKPYDRS